MRDIFSEKYFLSLTALSLYVALINPDDNKEAVLKKPGPERETRAFRADRVVQVILPRRFCGRRSAGDDPTNFLKASRRD